MNERGEYQLHVLGMYKLERGTQVVKLSRRKAAVLLAYLALHPQRHRRDELATLLWGDSLDEEASQSLRTTLFALRHELGDDILLADNDTVQLSPTFPLWVDAMAFEGYARRFLAEPPFDLSTGFIDLYEGDLLPEVDDDWVISERERLHALYVEVLLHSAQQMRSRSAYEQARQFAQRVLAIEPSNERAHQHLMFCFVAMGDRSAALKQYQTCQRVLQADLGVEPLPETRALYQWIKGQPAHAPSKEARLTNLPIPLTSFVGREKETAQIKRLLAQHRLVTVTGPGGSGKTRLAIQVTGDLLDVYKNGVWFSDLAGVRTASLVANAVAQTLGIHPSGGQPIEETIADGLRSRHTLLVWDNCEQVAAGCAQLAQLILSSCPQVTILLTSRAALGVASEVVWPLPPLSVPAAEAVPASLAGLARYEATHLFIERATTAHPGIPLLDQDVPAVVSVCRQLDGLPLAIELAAARVRVLPVSQIAGYLHERFSLLSSSGHSLPPRQRSLRATIDWSYDLLDQEEQTMLRSLSVFVGGFSPAGAAAVYAGHTDEAKAVDLVSRLVDKSLLSASRNEDEARFRLLDTIRLYAWEKLVQAGEKDEVVARYVSFYASLVARDVQFICFMGSNEEEGAWLRLLGLEHDNLRAALAWCRETGNSEPAIDILSAWQYWYRNGEASDMADWVEILAQSSYSSPTRQIQVLVEAGLFARASGDLQRSFALTESALALARTGNDEVLVMAVLTLLGRTALSQGKYELMVEMLGSARPAAREAKPKFYAWLLDMLAEAQMRCGDLNSALATWQEALAVSQERCDQEIRVASITVGLGHLHRLKGDYEAAARLYREGLTPLVDYQFKAGVLDTLEGLAAVAAAEGRVERAGLLWGAVQAAQGSLSFRMPTDFTFDYAPDLARMRQHVGEATFDEILARGRAMTIEQAVQYGLGDM